MMGFKVLIGVFVVLIALLQYRLWLGDGGIKEIREYQVRLDVLAKQMQEKKERNDAIAAEVLDLQKAQEAVEERARYELGMIKEDETFFQVLE